ncbi:hypothetical protein ODV21_07780 [Lactobacillus amylovorus]|nr:hypothetical protein [Lactobacillus amylovorus]
MATRSFIKDFIAKITKISSIKYKKGVILMSDFSKESIQRAKDEVKLQKLISNIPVEKLDTPQKIEKWLKEDY